MVKKHSCEGKLPFGSYGDAIDDCDENDDGELWAGNGEYRSQVNFCPFCGFKAKVEALSMKDEVKG